MHMCVAAAVSSVMYPLDLLARLAGQGSVDFQDDWISFGRTSLPRR